MLPGKRYTPEDFLWMAWRRRWVLVVPLVVFASATAVVSALLPDRYRSETTILVVPQRVPESYVRSTVTARIEDRLQSIQQQILSRTRLERIIQEFSLFEEERKTWIMEDIVARMRANIAVNVVRGDAFRVSYIGDEPRTVMRVTERLATAFIDENLRDRELLAEGTNQFLESQLEEARRRLVEQEQKLAAYQKAHAGELPSQANVNLQVLQNTQLEIQTLVDGMLRDQDRRVTLERTIAELSSPTAQVVVPAAAGAVNPGSGPPMGGTTAEQLAAARESLAALQLRLTPEHPDVQRGARLVSDLEARLEAESLQRPLSAGAAPPPAASPAELARRTRLQQLQTDLQNLDRQIAAKQADEQRLRKLAAEYQARVEMVPARQAELTELTRDYATLQNLYNNLLSKKEDSRIAANLERRQVGEQFKLLDPARLPEKPFTPNRLRINLLGAVFGLAFGMAIAAFLEYRDTSFRTDDDVTMVLTMPVLARIPVMLNAPERRRVRRMRIAASMTAVAMALVAAGGALAWKSGKLDGYRQVVVEFLR